MTSLVLIIPDAHSNIKRPGAERARVELSGDGPCVVKRPGVGGWTMTKPAGNTLRPGNTSKAGNTLSHGKTLHPEFSIPSSGIGSTLRFLVSTDSTNRVAREWAAKTFDADTAGAPNAAPSSAPGGAPSGAPDGAVVLADHQEAGRGRLGRTWQSSPGQNLLFTVILKNREPLISNHEARGILPLATSLAVADTIQFFLPHGAVQIKWPNDVLVGGKKCAGILVESVADASFLIGIGLNVNESNFSDDVRETATSMLLEDGRHKDRSAVYDHLLMSLNFWLPRVFVDAPDHGASDTRPSILKTYVQRMAGIGEAITLNTHQTQIQGNLLGVHEDGGLMVELDGVAKVYYAGEVSFNHRLP